MPLHLMLAAVLAGAAPVAVAADATRPPTGRVAARIERILRATPLVDGHNDLAIQLRTHHGSGVEGLESGGAGRDHPLMTDIARLRAGRVGGQFWSVYIDAAVGGDEAIRQTIEQIDLVDRLVAAYPRDLELARSADDIVRIHRAGRIASLIGIEGGHQIGGSLAALRMFHRLGARYMTLAHFKTNEWIDSATDEPRHNGLAPFGRAVVGEMNRIGMLVDLSHVSPRAMTDVIAIARAPVIFSHSGASAVNDHPRNVPDDVLRLLAANGGLVMVIFLPEHVSASANRRSAARKGEEARLKALLAGRPDRIEAALAAWDRANPPPRVPIATVADHIDHVARIAGHHHVGIGSDFDGFGGSVDGLGGVDGFPLLFAELVRRGWSDADLARLAGGNLLRVLRRAEAVAASLAGQPPATAPPGTGR